MSKKPLVSVVGLLLVILTLVSTTPGASAQSSTLFINEILVGNASTTLDTDFYNYSSWVEIYNAGASAVNLQGYSLSYQEFEIATPFTWKIPVSLSVPPNGHVLLWLDEQNTSNHASFEMDMRGDMLQLLNPTGAVLDSVTYDMRLNGVLLPDISYGRQTDGSSVLAFFDQPTPAASNTAGLVAPALAAAPLFSPPGGFYAGNQSVSLSTSEAGGQIRYTTDGSIPTPASPLYAGPIAVTAPTVVRARVFVDGKLDSLTASNTYLIGVDTDLPVVSLATKPAHLFDNTIGIYVAGTNGITGNCSNQPVNWNQKWERPASMEMYEADGSRVVAQDIGFEIHGGCSRKKPLKSLELKTRRTYGDNDIDYAILPDKPLDEYKRLILRNSGQDSGFTLFSDAMQQYLVRETMDIDYQAYRPVVVFLNGAYWGILNLRDKADESFPEQNYGLDADTDFDFIENNGGIHAGNKKAWTTLHKFVSANDLTIQANYDYVASQVDLVEYMNYFITELYTHNIDWPNNNVRYWRAYDNGRWRWVLQDLDAGFENPQTDYLYYVLNEGNAAEKYQTLLFRKLMENPVFRYDFAQRFASHLNISFTPARVNTMIDWFRAGIASEMPAHIARWGAPASIATWDGYINGLRSFGDVRAGYMRDHLNNYLGSPGTANLSLHITGGGDILAAGVKIPGSGYSGPYFKTVPMTIEAVPQSGWKFVQWLETGETTPLLTVTLTGDMTRTAVFEEVTLPNLVINEIHYNPASAQGDDEVYEFVEIYNAGGVPVSLAGFKIENGISHTFPAGASIAAGEYVVVAKTAATYAGQGYQVFQWSDGDLSNGGETLSLTDGLTGIIDAVAYDDEGAWPTAPDGGGPSLSLLSPALDNSLAASWAASVTTGGSPGAANAFTPPEPASLTIVKQVVGDAPAADWQFTGGLGAFSLPAAGGQQTFSDLTPGSYQVMETAVADYTAGVTCSNGASGGSSVTVNLTSGADVTCTFVNTFSPTLPASLTIVKQVVGDVPAADWQFTGDLGAFSLPAAGGQQTFSDLAPGGYQVTETAVADYTAGVTCTNGASGGGSVTVDLTSGADVTCTFVNTFSPTLPASLTIVKQVVGDVPAADWQFTGDLGAFTLPAAGGQQTFSDLAPGGYQVTETAVAGYTAEVTCTNGASGGGSVTVSLASGEDVTCTFVNTASGEECPPVPGNVLLNPGFEDQAANWAFFTNGTASFSIATANPFQCAHNAQVSITASGSDVQLYQTGFLLLPNTSYTLKLAGRSSNGRDAQVFIQRDSAPQTNYGLRGFTMNLTPVWQVFEVEFTTGGFTTATTDTRLRIWLAPYDVNGTVFEFDDVVLVQN